MSPLYVLIERVRREASRQQDCETLALADQARFHLALLREQLQRAERRAAKAEATLQRVEAASLGYAP